MPPSGQFPVPPPPPCGTSRSDHPPPPSFPMELPPPSPPLTPAGSTFMFSTKFRFGPPGTVPSSVPPGVSSMSVPGGVPFTRYVPYPTSITAAAQPPSTHPSVPEKRYPSPSFTRPICNTCHVNCVSVRESHTNFCERCFQDALRRRGKNESPKASRPTCRICRVNFINVKRGEMIYCERCWQEALGKRGIGEDGSVGL